MSLHYKVEHKDKIGECKCGDISLSGIRLTKFIEEASDPNPNYNFNPYSSSNSNSNPNSNYNPHPNSNSISNSRPNSNANPNSNSNSNLRSSFAVLHSSFADLQNSFANSTSITKPSPIEIKIDLTNNVCSKCNVIKQ